MNRAIRLILLFLGLLFLFFLIYRIGISEVITVISGAKLQFILGGVLVYLIGILTRSLKWFVLARLIKKEINYQQFLPLYLVNSLMGNLTPLQSGEAVAPLLFKKYLKIPVGQGFSVVILDRFFELIIFTILLALAILYILNSGIQNSLILSVFRAVLIALFLLLTFFIIVLVGKKITLKIVKSLRILRFIEKELDIFYNTLPLLKKTYQFLIPLTLAGWFLQISASYLVYTSIFSVSFAAITVAQIIMMGTNLATFIPGGIGIAEVSIVYILNLFGYSFLSITSGALLARLFLTGSLIIAGLTGFIFLKYSDSKKQ